MADVRHSRIGLLGYFEHQPRQRQQAREGAREQADLALKLALSRPCGRALAGALRPDAG